MHPTNQKKRKIVAYCRVSTAMQGSGLEPQVRQVRQYCDLMQIKDVEIFTDENQSGAKQNRPALDRMMKAIRENEVESVIVPAFSRLARSTKAPHELYFPIVDSLGNLDLSNQGGLSEIH